MTDNISSHFETLRRQWKTIFGLTLEISGKLNV